MQKAMQKSVRRARFEKVAARRTQKILEYLDSLANCSNRNNYEYSDTDIKKMFKAIKDRLSHTEALYENELKKTRNNKFTF